MTSQNAFRTLWDLGYRDLLPVIPPDATMSPRSSITGVGKSPGIKTGDGTWLGFAEWQRHETTEADLASWHAMGASVGLRRGRAFMLDIDAYDEPTAAMIEARAIELLGPAPCRVGQWPKRALLYRTDDNAAVPAVKFAADRPGQVEIPMQTVMHGIHTGTRKPYAWPRPIVPFDALTNVTREALLAFMAEMRRTLPAAISQAESVDRKTVPQAELRGDPDLLDDALAFLPNVYGVGPGQTDYERWIRMAAACRGAYADFAQGQHAFVDWSDKSDVPEHKENAARAYASLDPPFALGADYIFDAARRSGWSGDAHLWLEPEPPQALFPETESWANSGRENAASYAGYEVLSIGDLYDRPDPVFLVDRHIPEQSVGFLYGDPGTGKSFIALDWALHLAFDKSAWHGDEINRTRANGHVIYLAGEGASGFKTRVGAWCLRHGVQTPADGRFGLVHQSVNFMSPDDVKRLVATLRARFEGRVSLVVVDTVSRAMPGADENLQKEMTLFVKACDLVRDAFSCAVLGVHHAGKSGDMRGSTVLRGAGDYVFKLERKKGAGVGHLSCEKQKDAPDGWSDAYRFDTVTLGEDARGRPLSSLVPVRCDATGAGGSGEDVIMTPDVSARILDAMRAAWDSGEAWGRTYHAGERHAARRMIRDFGLVLDGAEEVLRVWLASGVVVEDMVSKKSKRMGLRVVGVGGVSGMAEGAAGALDEDALS